MSQKLWDGRFAEKTDRLVEKFTASIQFDHRLYGYDIDGSSAHARMLAKTGIISDEEASGLVQGLGQIKREIERGEFEFDPGLEDIHMHIETRLIQLVGKTAQKLHTARSRNDQIALDTRMYLKDWTQRLVRKLITLRQSIVATAKSHMGIVLPGYTHLQRAQPVLLSHHLMAYYEMFTRDAGRFEDGLKRIDVMPLGTAALAGTTFPIDRHYTAEMLGFSKVSANSIDSVSDRDFVIEFLAGAGVCMMHFSRLSEELILWSSAEYGFIEIPDAYATGSSIMPQKKNPDVAELTRGKTGRTFGNLIAVLTVMKGLPLSYNRDMQEDKEALFDTVDTLSACIDIFARMIPKLKINRKAMSEAAGGGFMNATDMADYLVLKGMPFREAHNCVGKAVAFALGAGKELNELKLDELKQFSSSIESDIFDALSVEQMIDRRRCIGGTASDRVADQIEKAETVLAEESDQWMEK